MPHVSLITLGVDDLSRARAFYEALGWRRSAASVEGEVVFLQGGTVVLALYGRADLARDAGVASASAGTEAGTHAVALAVNLPDEADVDALLATAAAAGGRVTRPARRASWGGYSGYVTDPDGHLWEIAHNPLFPLDAEGRVELPDGSE